VEDLKEKARMGAEAKFYSLSEGGKGWILEVPAKNEVRAGVL
jgi:hypothetical protein